MRVYEGTFTAADTDGTSQGLAALDCAAEKLDLRGAHFYTDGTFTTGSISLQHNRDAGETSNWFTLTQHTTATEPDQDGITIAPAAIRIITSGDFVGTMNWKLVIPERSEVHPG